MVFYYVAVKMPLSAAERQKRYRDKIKEDAAKLLELQVEET